MILGNIQAICCMPYFPKELKASKWRYPNTTKFYGIVRLAGTATQYVAAAATCNRLFFGKVRPGESKIRRDRKAQCQGTSQKQPIDPKRIKKNMLGQGHHRSISHYCPAIVQPEKGEPENARMARIMNHIMYNTERI